MIGNSGNQTTAYYFQCIPVYSCFDREWRCKWSDTRGRKMIIKFKNLTDDTVFLPGNISPILSSFHLDKITSSVDKLFGGLSLPDRQMLYSIGNNFPSFPLSSLHLPDRQLLMLQLRSLLAAADVRNDMNRRQTQGT